MADYDPFARIYNSHWGNFPNMILPALEKLALDSLPPNAHILDVCCGTGQFARTLLERGYEITGVDQSNEMLAYARQNAPGANFIQADVREFTLSAQFHAAFSTFDSLNHLLSLDDLRSAFRNVHATLIKGGVFVFDLNMEDGFLRRWRQPFNIIEEESVIVVNSSYDAAEHLATAKITFFYQDKGWQRRDLTLTQRAYTEAEVRQALKSAGFTDVNSYDAEQGLSLRGQVGRMFFVGRKG